MTNQPKHPICPALQSAQTTNLPAGDEGSPPNTPICPKAFNYYDNWDCNDDFCPDSAPDDLHLLDAHHWRLMRQNLRLTPSMVSRVLCAIGRECSPATVKSWERGASFGPPIEACRLVWMLWGFVSALELRVRHKMPVIGSAFLPERYGDQARQDLQLSETWNDLLDDETVQALQIAAWDRAFTIWSHGRLLEIE